MGETCVMSSTPPFSKKETEKMELVSSLSLKPSSALAFKLPPLSYRPQKRPPPMQVSCRTTHMDAEDQTQNTNFYKLLSLSPKTATLDEIKRAYRSMALRYHPDVCHEPSMKEESMRMFVQLNAAYKTLSNPVLREAYDCDMGLRSERSIGDERWRIRCQEQIVELKRRSNRRMAKRDGSWRCRMRTRNIENNS